MRRCAKELLIMHDWFLPVDSLFCFFLKVSRQVSQCNCPKRFQVEQISANRYRVRLSLHHIKITNSKGRGVLRVSLYSILCFVYVLQFGDSQQLRMVRILRSTLMVRVGGGWTALDEFLVKNDPCRGQYVQAVPSCCCGLPLNLPLLLF